MAGTYESACVVIDLILCLTAPCYHHKALCLPNINAERKQFFTLGVAYSSLSLSNQLWTAHNVPLGIAELTTGILHHLLVQLFPNHTRTHYYLCNFQCKNELPFILNGKFSYERNRL